jgi:hypothetical protein
MHRPSKLTPLQALRKENQRRQDAAMTAGTKYGRLASLPARKDRDGERK